MNNFIDKQTYVVLTFAAVSEFTDLNGKTVKLMRDAIVEAAAVKIKNRRIAGHYHSFAAIDGYDAHDLQFDDLRWASYYVDAAHLIGAPTFGEVAEKLSDYIGSAILIVKSASPSESNPFTVFKESAKNCGYVFNNTVVEIGNIYSAAKLHSAVADGGVEFRNPSLMQIAQALTCEKEKWTEIFADHDIYFDPDSEQDYNRGRDDPLSWALMFARLCVKLFESALEPVDEDLPF